MVCVPHTANWRRVGPEHRPHRIRGLSSNHPDAAGHLSAALPWCCAQSTVKQIFLCRLSGVARVLLVHVDPPRDYISHRHTHTPHCTVVDVIFPAWITSLIYELGNTGASIVSRVHRDTFASAMLSNSLTTSSILSHSPRVYLLWLVCRCFLPPPFSCLCHSFQHSYLKVSAPCCCLAHGCLLSRNFSPHKAHTLRRRSHSPFPSLWHAPWYH